MNGEEDPHLPSPLVIIGTLLICYYWIPALEWKLVTRTHGKYFVVYIVLITSVPVSYTSYYYYFNIYCLISVGCPR